MDIANLQRAELQFLDAHFNGQHEKAKHFLNLATDMALTWPPCDESDVLICRVLLNQCRSRILYHTCWRMKDNEWKDVLMFAEKVYHLLEPKDTHQDILPLQLRCLCFLGWSHYFLNQWSEAARYWTLGKSQCTASPDTEVIPDFGNLKSESSWKLWLDKCVLAQQKNAQPSDNDLSGGARKVYAKDWNAIEKHLDVELKQDELAQQNLEGEEALQNLLKTIYRESDENTRRAMNKSYQLSAGTVLSTNWDDVKHNNYDKVN